MRRKFMFAIWSQLRAMLLSPIALLGHALRRRAEAHRVAIQVDQNDPQVMNLALNNATNMIEYYRGKNEDVDVEIVAYGPGLHMLRDDTSPVKDRIKQLKEIGVPQQDPVFGLQQHQAEHGEGRRPADRDHARKRPSCRRAWSG